MTELQQTPLMRGPSFMRQFLSKRHAIARNPYFIGVFVTTPVRQTGTDRQ